MAPSLNTPESNHHEWRLSRRPSIRPGLMLGVLAALAVLTLSIGVFWLSRGAWFVLPFAVIEVSALAVAFWVHARHAGDMERVLLHQQALELEQYEAGAQTVMLWPAYVVKLCVERNAMGKTRVWLDDGLRRVPVARWVGETERRAFVAQLRSALAQVQSIPQPA